MTNTFTNATADSTKHASSVPMRTAAVDAHGYTITGDADSIALYNTAIDQLLPFAPDVVDTAGSLATAPAPIPMGLALGAYLNLTSTNRDDLHLARTLHAALQQSTKNEREQLHERAIASWLGGSWLGAASILDELLIRWPNDVLALIVGHQLDFFVGDAQNLRDRPLRTLREMDPQHAHVPFVRGMAAFGLEESGHYSQALDFGLSAVGANCNDVWAVHAVSHAYEMLGQVDEGIRFMTDGGTKWEADNLFTVHLWWHLALFRLEAGQHDQVLGIYDANIHNTSSAGVPLEMVDASAMLWRLRLDEVDSGDRFAELAESWVPIARAEPWYVFNDVHATMAFVGAGMDSEARTLIDRLADSVDLNGTNAMMTAKIGLPASRAVLAHSDGRFDDVIAELMPIRRQLNAFGGSHAQRDVLQRTLLDAALRAGRYELARALTAERLSLRDTNVYSWVQRARALRALGDEPAAAAAAANADAHRLRFAGA